MDYTKVLIKPLVSEKATMVKETANKVVFFVYPDANKVEIRKAVEEAFNVRVDDVAVVRKRPRTRMKSGRKMGRISGYKKAYITLAPGEKIELFEGV
jgi:large subunit ribosomal protein L23